MRRLLGMLLLIAISIGAGCFPPAPPQGGANVAGPPAGRAEQGLLLTDGAAIPAGYGVLRLVIRWPEAPRQTAIIPSDTNTLAIKVLDGATQLAYQEAARPQSSASQTISLAVKAATNLTVEVKSYREAKPLPGDAQATAQGLAIGVNIVRSQMASVTLTMASLSEPQISGLSQNVGKVGDTVAFSGVNLAPGGTAVTFNGVAALDVTQVSPSRLDVVVPQGATVGPIKVSIGNQTSSSQVNFWVVSGVGISAPRAGWDPSSGANRLVLAQTQLQFSATPQWVLKSGENLEQYGSAPAAVWSGSVAAAGSIDAGSGLYTAADNSASTGVKAVLGPLQSTAVQVTNVKVTGVTLDPTGLDLNLPAPNGYTSGGYTSTGSFAASVQYSSAVSISGVTWSVATQSIATPSVVSLTSGGLVTAGARGTATIKATSIDDSRVSATAGVTVKDRGLVDLEVR